MLVLAAGLSLVAALLAVLVVPAGDVAAAPTSAPAAAPDVRAFTPIVSLVFSEQPVTATRNTALDPPPMVTVVDAAGRAVPDAGIEAVEVAVRNPPGVLGVLGGRTSVPVADGEAVLDDLRIRTTGEGYRLDVEVALGGTWLEVTSEPFAVVADSPPRPGHVDPVDCAQAAAGSALIFLDGRVNEAGLLATQDARGVRLAHAEVAPTLTVGDPGPADQDAGADRDAGGDADADRDAGGDADADADTLRPAAVSGRSLLLDADDEVTVVADRLLPSSPLGVWLLGDPPCPLAAAQRSVDGVGGLADLAGLDEDGDGGPGDDAPTGEVLDDAAMVEVTPMGTVRVDAAGAARDAVALPEGLTPGTFTVQVVGTLDDGRSMVAAFGVLLTPPAFPDVDPDGVHTPAIRRMAALDITTGRADGTYGPAATVTRGQLASFLARALELDTGGQPPFPDALGTVHEGAVAAVAEAGIAGGYVDGRFGVGDPIRRDQLASMLAVAAGLAPRTEGPFGDVEGNVHAPAINAVAAAGIAFGDGQGRYLPADPVRRDQQASLVARLLDHDG